MVTDYNDTSRLLSSISVVCHNNYQRRDTQHLAPDFSIHLVTHVVLISSWASYWPLSVISVLSLAASVVYVVTITSWGSHRELGFLNTSPPHCIALLWIQKMSPSLSVIAVSYDPELSHFSQLSLKCSDDDKDTGYRQSRWGQGGSDSISISQETGRGLES